MLLSDDRLSTISYLQHGYGLVTFFSEAAETNSLRYIFIRIFSYQQFFLDRPFNIKKNPLTRLIRAEIGMALCMYSK